MKENFFVFTTSAIAISLTGATAALSADGLVSAGTSLVAPSQAETSVFDGPRTHLRMAQAASSAPSAEGDAAEASGEVSEDEMATLMDAGEQHYTDFCAACHDDDGSGNVGPALAGLEALEDAALVYSQIAHGSGEMPAFDSVLDPEAIRAVGTYIRNSWGNDFGPVTEENAQSEQ